MRTFLLPYIQNYEDLILIFYVLARVTGLFWISPILNNTNLPATVKSFFVFMITTLLTFSLFQDYRGPDARFTLPELSSVERATYLSLGLTLAKETAVGYLIGFSFFLVYEALVLAGQSAGFMVGFSIARVFDPISGNQQTILSQVFIMLASLILLAADWHHVFFTLLKHSFMVVPLGQFEISHEFFVEIATATARIFVYGIKFAAIPFVILFLVVVSMGFLAKIMPELNVFMLGFSLKFVVGYYAMILAIGFFPILIQQGLIEANNLSGLIMHYISGHRHPVPIP